MRISSLSLLFLCLSSLSALAEDKGGLRVMVTKKTLDRADGKASYSREIDRTMALKATFKNISTKDLPEGKIGCIILVRRWATETGATERYTKELKLDPLKTAQDIELLVGEYHIGGHMHGTATYHVDQVIAWKLTVEHGTQKTDFLSSGNFESENKRSVAATN